MLGYIRICEFRSQRTAFLINFGFFAAGLNGGLRNSSCCSPPHALATDYIRNRSIQAQDWSHGFPPFLPSRQLQIPNSGDAQECSYLSSTPVPGPPALPILCLMCRECSHCCKHSLHFDTKGCLSLIQYPFNALPH